MIFIFYEQQQFTDVHNLGHNSTVMYNEGYTTLQKNSKQYKKVNTKAASVTFSVLLFW